MPAPLVLLLGGGGAVAIAVASKKPAALPPTHLNSSGGVQASTGASFGDSVGHLAATGGKIPVGAVHVHVGIRAAIAPMPTRGDTQNGRLVTWGAGSAPVDTAQKAKLDKIDQYASAVYNHLADSAKVAGADFLNSSLGLDPPLDGSESWDEMSKRVAGAVAGAAGAAAGEYLGGPVGAYIGKAVGAYLGTEITDLTNKALDEIGPWFDSKWSDVEDWVKSEYSDIAGAIGDAASDAGDAISDGASDAANYIGDGLSDVF